MLQDSDAFRLIKFLWGKIVLLCDSDIPSPSKYGQEKQVHKNFDLRLESLSHTGPCSGQLMIMLEELNNEMLRKRYAVNNAGSNARGKKFSEICREKNGLAIKTEAFCYRCKHFSTSSVFKEKINF